MQDPFDPYLQWLDIPAGDRPPNHYDLLGVAMFSDDLQAIAQAADARMTRIRKIRPGPRLADWGRLLDKINAAKVCLSNPTSKAAYDASLGGHAAARSKPSTPSAPAGMPWQSPTPAPLSPVALPQGNLPGQTPPSQPQPKPGVLPGLGMQSPALQTPGLQGFGSQSPGSQSPQLPSLPLPGSWPTATPTLQPVQPASGQQSHVAPATPSYAAPATPSSLPLDASWRSTDSASQPSSPSSIGPTASGVVAVKRRGAAGRRKIWGRLAISVLLLLIIAALADLTFYVMQHREETLAALRRLTAAEDASQPEPAPPATAGQQPSPAGETPVKTIPGNPAETLPKTPGKTPPHAGADVRTTLTNPRPSGSVADPPSAPTVPPAPVAAPAAPAVASTAPSAERQAKFRQAVSDARFSMSERDLSGVREHLETAKGSAQSDADQEELIRLESLLGSLEQFWKLVGDGLSGLGAGGELIVQGNPVAVVEADRDRLVIKAEGTIRRYQLASMPTPIVLAVVQETFTPDDPYNKLHTGSFLATDPHGDRNRARQLWQEAAQAGIEVGQLLPELDVDYSGNTSGQ